MPQGHVHPPQRLQELVNHRNNVHIHLRVILLSLSLGVGPFYFPSLSYCSFNVCLVTWKHWLGIMSPIHYRPKGCDNSIPHTWSSIRGDYFSGLAWSGSGPCPASAVRFSEWWTWRCLQFKDVPAPGPNFTVSTNHQISILSAIQIRTWYCQSMLNICLPALHWFSSHVFDVGECNTSGNKEPRIFRSLLAYLNLYVLDKVKVIQATGSGDRGDT